jgi:hypothetical protein
MTLRALIARACLAVLRRLGYLSTPCSVEAQVIRLRVAHATLGARQWRKEIPRA